MAAFRPARSYAPLFAGAPRGGAAGQRVAGRIAGLRRARARPRARRKVSAGSPDGVDFAPVHGAEIVLFLARGRPLHRHRRHRRCGAPTRARRVARSAVRNRPWKRRYRRAARLPRARWLRRTPHRRCRMAGGDDAARLVGERGINLGRDLGRIGAFRQRARSRRRRTAPCARRRCAARPRRAPGEAKARARAPAAICRCPTARRPRRAAAAAAPAVFAPARNSRARFARRRHGVSLSLARAAVTLARIAARTDKNSGSAASASRSSTRCALREIAVEHDIGGAVQAALDQIHEQKSEIVEHVDGGELWIELDGVEQHRLAVDAARYCRDAGRRGSAARSPRVRARSRSGRTRSNAARVAPLSASTFGCRTGPARRAQFGVVLRDDLGERVDEAGAVADRRRRMRLATARPSASASASSIGRARPDGRASASRRSGASPPPIPPARLGRRWRARHRPRA